MCVLCGYKTKTNKNLCVFLWLQNQYKSIPKPIKTCLCFVWLKNQYKPIAKPIKKTFVCFVWLQNQYQPIPKPIKTCICFLCGYKTNTNQYQNQYKNLCVFCVATTESIIYIARSATNISPVIRNQHKLMTMCYYLIVNKKKSFTSYTYI